MRLGIIPSKFGRQFKVNMDMIKEAEALGFESAWTSEAWGNDALTPASWILAQTTKLKVGTAIIQMPARTPSMAAMSAMTLNDLSDGRFILGIGPSGPQVIEGWHGVPFGRPMTRTREYIEIIRKIAERKEPLQHNGYHYEIPYRSEGGTGLGKPLKSILHGDPSMPIFTAAITPAGLRTAAEIADGVFPIFMNPERFDVIEEPVNQGFEKAGNGKSLDNFDICPFVAVQVGDDLDKCRAPIKAQMALYIGGMGARDKNFYNDYAKALGYPDEAKTIQDLFLSGKKEAAAAAVPDALVDEVSLVGPKERIKDRLDAWRDATKKKHVGALLLRGPSIEAIRTVAELAA